MIKLLNKKITKWINHFLTLVAFGFLIWYLKDNINQLSFNKINFNTANFVISIIFVMSAQFFQAYIWHLITCDFSCNISFTKAIYFRLKNEILKYIPGKVTQMGSLVIDYSIWGQSKSRVLLCIAIENVFSLIGGLLLSIFSLYFFNINLWIVIGAFLMSLTIMITANKHILKIMIIVYNKIKKGDPLISDQEKNVSRYLILYFLVWLLFGIGFWFLTTSLHPIHIKHFIYIMSVFACSSFIGFIAFFAPAGLGIREGSMALFLKNLIPSGILIVPIIISRIQLIFCDVLSFIAGFYLDKKSNNNK